MPKKTPLTAEHYGALINAADELAHQLRDAVDRWPFGVPPFLPEGLEDCHASQTLNRLGEAALALQRMTLSSLALLALERRFTAEIRATKDGEAKP